MAKTVPLFSSSKGNSYYISGNSEGILVDAGRSCKQLENALLSNEIDTRTIKAIFITHEHIDHCAALKVFAKRYDLPIYASKGTLEALVKSDKVAQGARLFEIEDEVCVGDMLIKRVDTSHDAADSCGYLIHTADNRRCAVVTDTGYLTDSAKIALTNCNMAVIESNHDVQMLKTGIYPYVLKQRVLGQLGHLSNVDCAAFLPQMVQNGVTRILLAHLSEENNRPSIALSASVDELKRNGFVRDNDYTIAVAPIETNGKSIIF